MELSLNSQEAGVYRNSEAECVSLCQVARLHADQVTVVWLFYFVFSVLRQHVCDINVQACGCDSLYRTITELSFLLF